MINYDETKLLAADEACEKIKKQFNLSHLFIRLNVLNNDINIELRQKEATAEVLTELQNMLSKIYNCKYKIISTPLLSGSYMDNPISHTTALYFFKHIN